MRSGRTRRSGIRFLRLIDKQTPAELDRIRKAAVEDARTDSAFDRWDRGIAAALRELGSDWA